jgi:aspartate carbamoyltransferase regulatory subunit
MGAMETLTANLTGRIRRERLGGRDYIVAPMTMIVPGVLNGSQGPLYYPEEQVARNPAAWNGIPIVVDHPTQNGMPVSARSPGIIQKYGIGTVYESVFNGRHVAEGWFDVENTRRIEPSVLTALEAGRPIELSTGLYTKNIPTPGVHNGRNYDAIATEYQPDHLAILVGKRGACSLDDGCGVLVNECSCEGDEECEKCKGEPTENEAGIFRKVLNWLTGLQPRSLVSGKLKKLNAGTGKGEVHEAAQDGFYAGKCGRCGEAMTDAGCPVCDAKLNAPKPIEEPVVVIENANQEVPEAILNGDSDMASKQENVSFLTANCDCWKGDEKTLNALPDEKLVKLRGEVEKTLAANAVVESLAELQPTLTVNSMPDFIKKKMGVQPEEDEEEEEEEVKKPTGNKAKPAPTKPTLKDWEASMPPEALAVWNSAKKVVHTKKAEIIAHLTANVSGDAKKNLIAVLGKKDMDELETLALLAPKPTQNADDDFSYLAPDFSGAAGGPPVANDEDFGDLPIVPVINWEEEAKAQRHKATA